MRGRKPKPTKLKILNGNPGKRPLNLQEPKPRSGLPVCPDHLDEVARLEWDRLSRELAALELLTVLDQGVLAAYCVAWSRWAKAEKVIAKSNEVIKGQSGTLYQNPYLAIANRALEQLHRFGALLGLDPSNRSRLVAGNANPADDLEDFLKIA